MGNDSPSNRNVLAHAFLLGILILAVGLGLFLLLKHAVIAHFIWFLLPLCSLAVRKSDWGRTVHSEVFRLICIGATSFSVIMAVVYLVTGYSAILDVLSRRAECSESFALFFDEAHPSASPMGSRAGRARVARVRPVGLGAALTVQRFMRAAAMG